MEKPGMGRGRTGRRAGLLAAVFLAILAPLLWAQEGEEGPRVEEQGPRVLVRTNPERPAAGSVWVLSLLIEHPVPEEVTVFAPPFTGAFFLDQFVKTARAAEPPQSQSPSDSPEAEIRTLAEYRFIMNSPGTFTLDSFTVVSPLGKTQTVPLSVSVRNAGTELLRPRFSWNAPQRIRAGEASVLELRISGWDSSRSLPGPSVFMPPVPEGVILEPEEGSAPNAAAVLRLKLIPLNVSAFILPARIIAFENAVLEIPGLRIPVDPAQPGSGVLSALTAPPTSAASTAPLGTAAPSALGTGAPPVSAERPPKPPFPQIENVMPSSPFLTGSLRRSREEVYRQAKNLWDRGYPAEALAEIRRNERDSLAGPFLIPLRKAAEKSLGLVDTGSEKWRPGKILFGTFAACLVLALALVLWSFFFASPGGLKKIPALLILVFLLAGGFCLYGFLQGKGSLPGQARFAVVRETGIRKVPDSAGSVIAQFSEAQPVRVPRTGITAQAGNADWVWAEAFQEESSAFAGWIPGENVIFY
jgi:hypothetical protein